MTSGRLEGIPFLAARACNMPPVAKLSEEGTKVNLFSREARARVFRFSGVILLLVAGTSATGYCKQSAIQYVTTSGNAGNSGTTWGSAKSTIAQAYAALPPCSVPGKSWNHCGDIEVGGGVFVVASPIEMSSPFVWIRGRGATITTLKYTGRAGCAISWTSIPLNAESGDTYAGGLFDLTIEGTGAPAGSSPWPLAFNYNSSPHIVASLDGACGVDTHDIEGFQMRGVEIENFTSGACWWDHATRYWNERFRISAELSGCAVGWFIQAATTATLYPGTTFGYGDFNLWINPTAAGQVGVLQSAGLLSYSNVHLIENMAGHTTAFALTNSAKWWSNLIDFHFEGPDSSTGFVLDKDTGFRGVGPVNGNASNSIDGSYEVAPNME